MKLGFIGLGIMGAPMAGHLLAAGHTLFVRTRSQVPAALSGATVCATMAIVDDLLDDNDWRQARFGGRCFCRGGFCRGRGLGRSWRSVLFVSHAYLPRIPSNTSAKLGWL